LLIAEVLVGRDKNLKAILLCRGQQIAVAQDTPTTLKSRFHLMRDQKLAEGDWSPLIEENTHSGNLRQSQAFRCMVENRTHLLDGDAREPLHKLRDLDPVFEVLKES
jgi:hypothetical protein